MPKKNTITQRHIDSLVSKSSVLVQKIGDKTTIVQLVLPNGFAINEFSSCVDPENYNEELGKSICIERIKNKIWELEGYLLQNKIKLLDLEHFKDTVQGLYALDRDPKLTDIDTIRKIAFRID